MGRKFGLTQQSIISNFKNVDIEKGGKKTGYYTNTSQNRKEGKVGQKYTKDKEDQEDFEEMGETGFGKRKGDEEREYKEQLPKLLEQAKRYLKGATEYLDDLYDLDKEPTASDIEKVNEWEEAVAEYEAEIKSYEEEGSKFKVGDSVSIIDASDMPISLQGISGEVVGTEQGTLSVPTYYKVKDSDGKIHSINPNYLKINEPPKYNITQENYNKFTDEISNGFGWIDPEDVARQWEGFTGEEISGGRLNYLKEALEANGLLKERLENISISNTGSFNGSVKNDTVRQWIGDEYTDDQINSITDQLEEQISEKDLKIKASTPKQQSDNISFKVAELGDELRPGLEHIDLDEKGIEEILWGVVAAYNQ